MAKILPHYHVRKGRGYWLATSKMKAAGFDNVRCGPDGPQAWAVADEWEKRWQAHRKGVDPSTRRKWPRDSVGDAFERFRQTTSWKNKKPATREDWERGWKLVEPVFGDQLPHTITFELLDAWYHQIKRKRGVDISYRAMKTWRSLYNVMASMRLVVGRDPSLAVRRETPKPRNQVWSEGEIVRLVKAAWRHGYKGVSCIIAIAWDTSFAPVDVRTLTPAHAVQTAQEWGFLIKRTKTSEDAFGTLSRRTQRLVMAYLDDFGATVLDDAPIFRSRGGVAGPKGGRPRPGAPYTKNTLAADMRKVRKIVFGAAEARQLRDLRRSGAVEANAGGGTVESISAKMGNSIDENKKLQKTYMPVNLAAVRAADEARRRGRVLLGHERNEYEKLKLRGVKS